MKHYEIELISIGRGHVNHKLKVSAIDLEDAEAQAETECRKHLLSSDVSITPTKADKNTYTVFAGWHTVGKVIIHNLDDSSGGSK